MLVGQPTSPHMRTRFPLALVAAALVELRAAGVKLSCVCFEEPAAVFLVVAFFAVVG